MSTLNVNVINGVGVTNLAKQTARAWVNFNGTGAVAIASAYNVASVTDNGTGLYTVNFTTAMPNVNYVMAGSAQFAAGYALSTMGLRSGAGSAQTVSNVAVQTGRVAASANPAFDDPTIASLVIFD